MRRFVLASTLLVTLLICMQSAEAALISASSASGTGTFNNSPSLIIDNVFPAEGSVWTAGTNVWWNGLTPQFTIDLGDLYKLEDIALSVDNNDTYQIDYSVDNIDYSPLFTLSAAVGEIPGGMDTFSTVFGNPEYEASIDFSSVSAQYLQIYATSGDNSYSIGEVQSFGSAIPEPSTYILLGIGVLSLFGIAYRRRKKIA